MPTKYAYVRGHATYFYYVGATTLPDVIPDLSRGTKLIMLHAAGSNGHSWHYQLDYLGNQHSPVALDLPGHGRSAGVEGLRSIQDYSDFVIAFADALKIDSAVFVGRSMGGAIAMDLAMRYPGRARAIVLIATAAKFDLPAERIEGMRAVTMGRSPQSFTTDGYSPKTIKERFEIVREGWGEQIRTDPRVRYTDMVACSQVNLSHGIERIERPTLILAGSDDLVTPPANAEFIHSRIRGSRLTVIPESAHNLTTERPAEANAALEQFLAELG